jgi:polar amino acid transport system ATP-binding protein
MTAAAVAVLNVSKAWGSYVALNSVTFEVAAGEVVALLGPSGAGKSTMLRCINHLETITGGRICIHGELIGYVEHDGALYELSDRDSSRQRQSIAMVFQSFNLFRHLTAIQNVMCGPLHVLQLPKAEARDRALQLLDKVGLRQKADSYPSQLSGGQQQRVAIARALAMTPRVMLLDEPTSALDPELSQEVVATIRKLAEEGQTMLIATHDMGIARDVSDRVIFMEAGAIVENAPSAEFFTAPRSERAKQFLARLRAGSL